MYMHSPFNIYIFSQYNDKIQDLITIYLKLGIFSDLRDLQNNK
jgi:hypothetical protein